LHELEFAAREDVRRDRPIQSGADRVAPEQGVVLSGAVEKEEVLARSYRCVGSSARKIGIWSARGLRYVGKRGNAIARSPHYHANEAVWQEITDDISRATARGRKVGEIQVPARAEAHRSA